MHAPKPRNSCCSEGIDLKYGARHLKRAIERFLVYPLSNLVATEQVETGDFVSVDMDTDNNKLLFSKQSGGMIVAEPGEKQEKEDNTLAKSDAVGLPLPQAAAAGRSKGNIENSSEN